jgi:O-antigen ligase
VVAEILSWLAFNWLSLNLIVLCLLAVVTIVLIIRRPIFALYIPLLELVWGSSGHSFNYGFLNTRLLIFLVVILFFVLTRATSIKELKIFKAKQFAWLWLGLLFLTGWGLGLAAWQHYAWANIFWDANAYLYLLYFPVWLEVYEAKYLSAVLKIIKVGALVVALKTLLVFNIFSQSSVGDLTQLYKWIRDTRTGLITPFSHNFFRVFMASQFFVVVAWWLAFTEQLKQLKNYKNIFYLIILSAALLISLSRSFWLGLAVALILLLINLWVYQKKAVIMIFVNLLVLAIGSLILVQLFYNLPRFNSFNIFSQRSTDLNEPAANSRLELLQPLWQEIVKSPLIGQGFGKEITYQSYDPRSRNADNPEGWKTTYAFEWGWLDQWLKAGVIFVLGWLLWLWLIYRRSYKMLASDPSLSLALMSIILALVVIHNFSPYLNHPLGLGLLMLVTVITKPYE